MTTEEQNTISPDPEDIKSSNHSEPETEHEYEFKAGERIYDRYRVIKPLGVGGFAEVYHCRDTQLPRDVAVKVLREKEAGLEDAHAAADFHHPNIVTVYALHRLDDGRPIIVFRYVEGQTLEDCLKAAPGERLPLDRDILGIISQIAETLDYAHQRGVIHRDVKPSNIILGSDGNAYLTDFGLAEVKPTVEAAKSMLSIDAPSGLSGTVPYMSPEQLAEGKPGDKHSDLYSLGVTAYRMLTGRFPYEGQGTVLIAQIIANVLVPPTEVNEKIPLSIEKVLLQALNKTPENRYASCSEFARDLDEAAEAYLAFSDQYEDALKLSEAGQWRKAKSAFERLKAGSPPGFKEIDASLEQACAQVELLEHFERAQEQIKKGAYQDALATLKIIKDKDSNYDVGDLYGEAQKGQARVEKQELEALYQQAVQQLQDEEFEACLNTWATIRARDPQYPDSKKVEPQAREQAKIQSELRALYDRGVEQTNGEEWDQASVTFRKLQQRAPDYKAKDVGRYLAVSTSMVPLLSLLKKARELLEQEEYASCVAQLDELRKQNDIFKPNEVAGLRRDALNRLYTQTKYSLQEEPFDRSASLEKLEALRKCAPDHPGLEELDKEFQIRTLQAELDDLYQKALEKLNRSDYEGALKDWETIQKQKEDLDYPDLKDVEGRAKGGLCGDLYHRAFSALFQKEPQKALGLWEEIRKINPNYPDRDRIEEQAREMVTECADLYRQAQEALSQGESQRALELWRKVCEVNPDFHDSQDVERQAQAMNLYNQAVEALRRGVPKRALELWQKVREVNPNHPDSQDVDRQARAMSLYNQAVEALVRGEPERALALWRQVRGIIPDYADSQAVERRAQAMDLYGQAVEALDEGDPLQALELWRAVGQTSPDYPDSQQVEERAQAMIAQRDRAQKLRRVAVRVGRPAAALLGIAILIALGAYLIPKFTPPPPTETVTPSTPTQTKTPTLSPTTPSPTPTLTPDTPTPTQTPSPTPTSTPTPTTLPSNDEQATVSHSAGASIYAAPSSSSQALGGIPSGEQVQILGRSSVGEWFYVRYGGVEGFAYAPRFEWSGDFDSLDVVIGSPSFTPPPSTTTTLIVPLTMDLWDIDGTGTCSGGGWSKSVYIRGHGGNGVYTYYWNGEIKGGPINDSITFEVSSTGAVIGTAKVVSGDGQEITQPLYIQAVNCD